MASIKVAMVIDKIELIDGRKDSSPTIALEAQKRGWEVYYLQDTDITLQHNRPYATVQKIEVTDLQPTTLTPIELGSSRLSQIIKQKPWYKLSAPEYLPLTDFDLVMMRKDPPFKLSYLHDSYILEFVEKAGVLVLNNPKGMRDCNEKLFIYNVPDCVPPSLVTADIRQFRSFLNQHKEIICKPLDGTRGSSIFHVKKGDSNSSVIFETLTKEGHHHTLCQKYISDIKDKGDKRIFIINGEPVPYALARIPASGEVRGNLASGGTAAVKELTPRDQYICQQLKPYLLEKNLFFVGIDIIGDYLTEINVANLACTRELNLLANINVEKIYLDSIEKNLLKSSSKSNNDSLCSVQG